MVRLSLLQIGEAEFQNQQVQPQSSRMVNAASTTAWKHISKHNSGMNPLHPKKLLLTKWMAVAPQQKDKHFLVTKVVQPEVPSEAIEWIEIEAVFSRAVQRIAWRELKEPTLWRQGWV